MSVIDEIKDRLDIIDVVGESVKLRKSGKNYTGFCPFHPNTRTPAFVVFPDTGTWRCFGACNEGGDVFSFLMRKEGWDFPETLRYLAQRAGVVLRERTPEEEAEEEAHERLRELMEAATAFYRHNLLQSAEGREVLEYLHGRALADETLESFEIGYAPASWDATMKFLTEKGYSQEELVQAGMVSEREKGGVYDRFRNRIMIPIRDARGRIAGFGARVVNPDDVPKFLNSPQTPLFDKGRILYGLDKARKAIRSIEQVVIVEGYMDVIGLHQAGHANVVSPMGTALTEQQLRTLKRFTRHIVLALDADAAGEQATLRGLTMAREALEREMDPVFDARGLVRHEGRLDADIRVVTLPPGRDPDEVVAEDPEAWVEMLGNAQTVIDYVLEVLTAGRDVEDAKVKSDIARQILPLIEDVSDAVEREAYRQTLARRLKVDERALLGWRPRSAGRRAAASSTVETMREGAGILPPRLKTVVEGYCLGVLLRSPDLLYRIDRVLLELGLERLSAQDFTGAAHEAVFSMVREAIAQEEAEPVDYWPERMDPSLLPLANDLLEGVGDLDLSRQKAVEKTLLSFLQLRERRIENSIAQLQYQQQSVNEGTGDDRDAVRSELEPLVQEVSRLARLKDRLEGIAHKPGALQKALMGEGW